MSYPPAMTSTASCARDARAAVARMDAKASIARRSPFLRSKRLMDSTTGRAARGAELRETGARARQTPQGGERTRSTNGPRRGARARRQSGASRGAKTIPAAMQAEMGARPVEPPHAATPLQCGRHAHSQLEGVVKAHAGVEHARLGSAGQTKRLGEHAGCEVGVDHDAVGQEGG